MLTFFCPSQEIYNYKLEKYIYYNGTSSLLLLIPESQHPFQPLQNFL